MKEKKCRDCGQVKPLEDFHKKKGNKDGRSTWCKECHKLRNNKWKNKNRDKVSQYNRNSYRYRDRKEYSLEYYANNKDRYRGYSLSKRYDLSLEQYQVLLESQNFKCKSCGVELDEGKHTHVDHCHNTGRIRGILCHNCNTALGLLQESKENCLKLARYIVENC